MSETEGGGPQIIASPIIKPSEQVGQNVLRALEQADTAPS